MSAPQTSLARWVALEHDVVDERADKPPAPGPDIDLDAVLLDVSAGGEDQAPLRYPLRKASRRS